MAGAVIEVKYFNTFVLKKTVVNIRDTIVWNGSFGIPKDKGGYHVVDMQYLMKLTGLLKNLE